MEKEEFWSGKVWESGVKAFQACLQLEKLPDRLFHYTDVKAVEEILKTKKLSMSNFKELNDPSELVYARDNHFDEFIRSYGESIPSGDQLQCRFWRAFSDNSRIIGCEHNLYTLSFSSSCDNDYLWEKYGDSDAGCMLAFDPGLIEYPSWGVGALNYWANVRYKPDDCKLYWQRCIDIINSEIGKHPGFNASDDSNVSLFGAAMAAFSLWSFPLLKEEVEWGMEAETRLLSLVKKSKIGTEEIGSYAHFGGAAIRGVLCGKKVSEEKRQSLSELLVDYGYSDTVLSVSPTHEA